MASEAPGEEALILGEPMTAAQAGPADAALVARARQGDNRAFEQLYLGHRNQMYNLCLNLCGDSDQAQDLLQETFVRAYRALPRFRGSSTFSTWLYRIAVNVCRDAARRRRRMRLAESAAPDAPDVGVAQTVALVRSALLRLSPRHRAALALRYTLSLSHQEMANVLGWSLPKVKVTIHRARQAFKEAYRKGGGSQP